MAHGHLDLALSAGKLETYITSLNQIPSQELEFLKELLEENVENLPSIVISGSSIVFGDLVCDASPLHVIAERVVSSVLIPTVVEPDPQPVGVVVVSPANRRIPYTQVFIPAQQRLLQEEKKNSRNFLWLLLPLGILLMFLVFGLLACLPPHPVPMPKISSACMTVSQLSKVTGISGWLSTDDSTPNPNDLKKDYCERKAVVSKNVEFTVPTDELLELHMPGSPAMLISGSTMKIFLPQGTVVYSKPFRPQQDLKAALFEVEKHLQSLGVSYAKASSER
jgi:hypothetical protein